MRSQISVFSTMGACSSGASIRNDIRLGPRNVYHRLVTLPTKLGFWLTSYLRTINPSFAWISTVPQYAPKPWMADNPSSAVGLVSDFQGGRFGFMLMKHM